MLKSHFSGERMVQVRQPLRLPEKTEALGGAVDPGRAARSPRRMHIFTTCMMLSLLGCSEAESLAWCSVDTEGVEVVASSGAGLWEEEGKQPRLVEIWRAGGLNEGQDLAYPVSVSASPTGKVAIADFQLSEVVVVEPDGTWLGPWGRRGRGPGELSTPVAAGWDPSDQLAVFDVVAPKVLFLRNGEPARQDVAVAPSFTAPIISSGQLLWAGVQPDGATLLQPTPEPADADEGLRTALLLRLLPGSASADTLVRTTIRTLPEGPYAGWSLAGWPRLLTAVGTDGSLAVGGTDASYRIVIYNSEGRPTRQICRDAVPLPVTDGERGKGINGPEALAQAISNAPLPDTPVAFGRIFWGARGRLWVQRDRPSPVSNADMFFGPGGALYDIFDEQGRYLGELRAPPRARLQTASGETVWAVEFGEMDEAWLVAYRLEDE